MGEVQKAKQSSFFQSDLERSKNYVKKSVSSNYLKTGGIADLVSKKEMFENDPESAFNLLEKYDAVSMDDIEDFMTKRISIAKAIRVDVVSKKS
jgi:predicted Zn-dependent peptidase